MPLATWVSDELCRCGWCQLQPGVCAVGSVTSCWRDAPGLTPSFQ